MLDFLSLEVIEDTEQDDVTGSSRSDVTATLPHTRSEVPNSFDAPHVHINPTEYNQDNMPGSPGESISAFPLATSAPPLEQPQTSSNQLPEQSTGQTTGNQPLEETAQGEIIYSGTSHTVETTTGESIPVQSIPAESTHVEAVPSQTASQENVIGQNNPVLTTPEKSVPVKGTPTEYPSISATPLEHSKPGETIVTIPTLGTSSSSNHGVPVLVKLPSKNLHLDGKTTKINSTVVNGTVIKINGTLYLIKGSLTKLPKPKLTHANKLVGSLLAGVAPKDSNEHLIDNSNAGITTNDDDDNNGEIFRYDGTASTTLEDKPFDAHVIKQVKIENKKLKKPPKKKLTGLIWIRINLYFTTMSLKTWTRSLSYIH